MQTLSELLASCEQRGGQLVAEVGADWMQGRSLYGGVQAVLASQAMLPFSDGFPIRTLQATLCAPVPSGTLSIQARLLRQGGNTRQVEARLMDGDETLALFVGIFGRSRESQISHDLLRPQGAAGSDPGIRFRGEAMPKFTKQFDAYLLRGHSPGSAQADTGQLYRLSLHDDADRASLAHVLTLADFPPPVALSWLPEKAPGSTMTWMLNFTGHAYDDQGLNDWMIDVELDSAHHGYTQQTVSLFAPDGYAVLRGTQCMVVFG